MTKAFQKNLNLATILYPLEPINVSVFEDKRLYLLVIPLTFLAPCFTYMHSLNTNGVQYCDFMYIFGST